MNYVELLGKANFKDNTIKEYKKVNPLLKNSTLDLYQSLLNFFLKKGKKSSIKKAIDRALLALQIKLNCSLHFVLLKFFSTMHTYVEVKTVRFRGKSSAVPFALSRNRRIYLALKLLSLGIKSNTKPVSFEQKFVNEMEHIINNKQCVALNLLQQNNEAAARNKAHIHYRW